MKWGQIAARATIVLAVTMAAACELVLGDLPASQEELSGAGGLAGAGGAATIGGGGTGGTAATTSTHAATSTTSTSSSSTSTSLSTSTTTGEGGGCPCPCDCDCDGFLAAGACGGMELADCDDTNDKVYPGQPVYYATASPNNGFDWDCNGIPERDPALDKAVDCASLLGIGCNAKIGFLGETPPACGAEGTWGTCKKSGLECLPDPIETGKKMTCK